MFDWEGRILDNKSILAVKAALPYLDIPVGEVIDLEGLLRAVRCFCQKREQKIIDMILNFFLLKRVMSMMNMMSEAQNSPHGMEGMFEVLKSQMPKEQQEMFDMMSMMMTAMEMNPGSQSETAAEEEMAPLQEEPEGFREKQVDFREAPREFQAEPERGSETVHREEEAEPIPEIWQRIAKNNYGETGNDRSE